MAEKYNPVEIDARWQKRWEEAGLHAADSDAPGPHAYVVTMYPYPSGDLHVGHWYPVTPTDAYARFLRMNGYAVLFPIGFDAFGLPAENAAIRNNVHPREWTYSNIRRMEGQLRAMGASFDWSREIITCDPSYYRWNQWFFLKFLENDLAYRSYSPVDWCPGCNTTLAREQVIGQQRECERCSTPVIKKELNQWFFRTTRYAEELLDFSGLNWPEKVITLQRNWIGRSEGAAFSFRVAGSDLSFKVFTTRPDTIFGATFTVLAPEHPLALQVTTAEQREAVQEYIFQASRQSETDRLSTEKERTGIFTGAYALHPLTGEPIPIYLAAYVLMGYGSGAIMAVPAHDERDFDFARRYELPVVRVIAASAQEDGPLEDAYTGPGVLVNSGPFTGMDSQQGGRAITEELQQRGIGGPEVTYRLRDWLISRQRLWGTPIPIIYCPACGTVPVPEEDLPVLLPETIEFRPTGESPLKFDESFLHVRCPRCGGAAERETDTMDTFVDSSWYWYRYLSPTENERPFNPSDGDPWLPLHLYNGGAEHAVMHLLYARFFHKTMRDLGHFDELRARHPERIWDEPFPHLFNQGVITSFVYRDENGRFIPYSDVDFSSGSPRHATSGRPLIESSEKMSKSKLNVVAPDDYVVRYGADVVRLFLMFIGPWEQGGPWNPRGVEGVVRFLNRVWNLVVEEHPSDRQKADPADERELRRIIHQTIRKVTEDYRRYSFNTVISSLMELSNALHRKSSPGAAFDEGLTALILMLAPLAPHLTEECWLRLGRPFSVHQQPWPREDREAAAEELIELAVQINGKVRERILAPPGASEDAVREQAMAIERVAAELQGRQIRRVIYVPGRLLNIVAG